MPSLGPVPLGSSVASQAASSAQTTEIHTRTAKPSRAKLVPLAVEMGVVQDPNVEQRADGGPGGAFCDAVAK